MARRLQLWRGGTDYAVAAATMARRIPQELVRTLVKRTKKISKIDYYIEEEKLVKENNIIYTIIKSKKGRKFYNYKQLYFGPILLKEKPALFYEKNKVDLKKLKLLYSKIPKKYLIYRFKTFCKIKLYQKI